MRLIDSIDRRERDLIDSFIAGQDPGFRQIVTWIDMVVYSQGWRSRISPADIKQQCLAAMIHNLRTGRYNGSGLQAYVQATANNLCLSSWRQIRADKKHIGGVLREENTIGDSTPENELLSKEAYETFLEVFRNLPGKCKRLLVLRYLRELSWREIAEKLGISEGAAKTRRTRCVERARQLRKML